MIRFLDNCLDQFAKWGVIICVFLMLFLSISNIVMRQFEMTYLWIEPLVRHLVFLATFFGGALATGNSQHIKIDIVSRLLEKSKNYALKNWVDRIILLSTLIALYILFTSSIDLVKLEMEDKRLSFFHIPTGHLLAIIPFGMGLIGIRVFLKFLMTFEKREI